MAIFGAKIGIFRPKIAIFREFWAKKNTLILRNLVYKIPSERFFQTGFQALSLENQPEKGYLGDFKPFFGRFFAVFWPFLAQIALFFFKNG